MWDKLNTLTPIFVKNDALGASIGTLVHVGGGPEFNPTDLSPLVLRWNYALYLVYCLFVCWLYMW
jgi:hypothetical protein